jgi:hypothetical protein
MRRSPAFTPDALGAGVARDEARTLAVSAGVFADLSRDALALHGRQQAEQRRAQEELADRSNRLVVMGAENRLREWISATSTGENSPFARKGLDAMGAAGEYRDAFNKYADGIAGGMANEPQRASFEAIRGRLGTDFQLDLERHTFREQNAYQDQEFQSKLTNITSTVGLAADDPRRVGQDVGDGLAAIDQQAKDRGWGPEQTEQVKTAFRTSAYTSVITALTARGNTAGAQAYFEQVEGQISAEAATAIRKNIEIGSVKDASRQHADRISALGLESLTKQIEEADKIENTDVRDATVARLKDKHNVQKVAQAESYQSFQQDLYTRTVAAYTQRQAFEPTPAELQRLGEDADNYLAFRSNLYAGKARKTSDYGNREFWRLMDLARDDADKFMAVDPWKLRNELDDQDFDRLMQTRLAVKDATLAQKDKQRETLDGTSPMVRNAFNETWTRFTGVDATPTEAQQKADSTLIGRIATMRRLVMDRVELLPKTAKASDVQQVIDDIFSQQVTATTPGRYLGIGVGPSMVGFTVGGGTTVKPIYQMTINDVPAEAKAQITEALRVAGLPVNDPMILQRYLARLAKR